jgi:uncharacterized protein
MLIEPLLIFELAALGLSTGFLAGLLGIGGGMIMVPFLTWILTQRQVGADLSIKMAIATSMATILFTSISSVRAHHARGAVRWDLVKHMASGIVVGGLMASMGIFSLLKGGWLAIVFALFVGFSATQMMLDKKPQASREMPGPVGRMLAGTVIGCLSGLVGAGGGFISVPFMVAHNVNILNAVATSAALGTPIALANTVGYVASGWDLAQLPPYSWGYVWLPGLVLIAACSVLTAPWGASVAHRIAVAQLKKVFSFVLYALAAYMLMKGLGY